MWPVVIDVSWPVSVFFSVCLSVGHTMSCAKRAELIKIPFGL